VFCSRLSQRAGQQDKLDGNLDGLSNAVEELIDACESLQIASKPTAPVLIEEMLQHTLDVLCKAVDSLQDVLAGLLCSNAKRGGTLFIGISSTQYRTAAAVSLPAPCTYCGNSLEEETRKNVLLGDERISLFCNSCGPIFEGARRNQMYLNGCGRMRVEELKRFFTSASEVV
jgi:hypothetical protein